MTAAPDLPEATAIVAAAKHAVREVVHQHRSIEKELAPLNAFGEIFDAIEAELSVPSPTTDLARLSLRLWRVCRSMFFVKRLITVKIFHILRGCGTASEGENTLVLIYCVRALVEHTGGVANLLATATRLRSELENRNTERSISEALERPEKAMVRAYFGSSEGDARLKPIHVNDLVQALTKYLPNAEEDYSWLSEHVHPNYGSNLVVSSGELGGGQLDLPIEFRAEVFRRCAAILVTMFHFLEDAKLRFGNELVALDQMSKSALLPGVTLGTWLSKRSLKQEGDGRTPQTPLRFPRARTKLEAMGALYKHFEEAGIEVQGTRMVSIDEGSILDEIVTDRGLFYFRSPTKFL